MDGCGRHPDRGEQSVNPYAAIPADTQPAARRAALAVHALGPQDRAWLLGRLPPAQRERLVPLLEELQALGIPPRRDLLDEAVLRRETQRAAVNVEVQEAPAAAPRLGYVQQRAALAHVDASAVAKLLQNEPPGLIAQLLEVQAWPWRQAVLEQLGAVKRRRVEELLDGLRRQVRPKAPEALQRALVAGLCKRTVDESAVAILDAAPPRRTATAIGSALKLRTAMGQWLAKRGEKNT